MFENNPDKPCRAEFACEAPEANCVFLVGTFNGWNPQATPMARKDNGEWTTVLELPPGNYHYRFLVVYRGQMNVRDADHYGTVSHVISPFRIIEDKLACG